MLDLAPGRGRVAGDRRLPWGLRASPSPTRNENPWSKGARAFCPTQPLPVNWIPPISNHPFLRNASSLRLTCYVIELIYSPVDGCDQGGSNHTTNTLTECRLFLPGSTHPLPYRNKWEAIKEAMNTIIVNSLGSSRESSRQPQSSPSLSPIVSQSTWHPIVQDAIVAMLVSSAIVALAYLYWAA